MDSRGIEFFHPHSVLSHNLLFRCQVCKHTNNDDDDDNDDEDDSGGGGDEDEAG